MRSDEQTSSDAKPRRRAHIGSYVLESLTTGMYGEPRHTIREYVQNAFDAIRSARKNGTLDDDEGTIVITVDDTAELIKVRDDGTGIRSEAAWGTLSSVGASTKDRTEQAGFRGIGRLAGLAYCEKLHFITKHRSDPIEATITFDCERLRRGMDPTQEGGEDIQALLTEAISDTYREVPEPEKQLHYTEVVLQNTKLAPIEITNVEALASYLCQTAPVGFHPELWPHTEKIAAFAKAQGEPLETVAIVMRHVEVTPGLITDPGAADPSAGAEAAKSTDYPLYKPYRAAHVPKGRAPVTVADVGLLEDKSGEKRWWGWIGEMPILGSLADEDAAGLRVRMRNIQIDGTEITDRMFSDIRSSYDRFNKWFIGEFHILSDGVVPNARRDSFEENKEWRCIQDEIRPYLQEFTKNTYRASRSRSVKFKELKTLVQEFTRAVEQCAAHAAGIEDGEQQVLLLRANEVTERLSKEVAKDLITEDEAKTIRLLQANVNEARRRVEKLATVAAENSAAIISDQDSIDVLKTVYDVIRELLDPTLYRDIKREIERRLSRSG